MGDTDIGGREGHRDRRRAWGHRHRVRGRGGEGREGEWRGGEGGEGRRGEERGGEGRGGEGRGVIRRHCSVTMVPVEPLRDTVVALRFQWSQQEIL